MKYCRYCEHYIESDVNFCTAKNIVIQDIQGHIECDRYAEKELCVASAGKRGKANGKGHLDMDGQLSLFSCMGEKDDC